MTILSSEAMELVRYTMPKSRKFDGREGGEIKSSFQHAHYQPILDHTLWQLWRLKCRHVTLDHFQTLSEIIVTCFNWRRS